MPKFGHLRRPPRGWPSLVYFLFDVTDEALPVVLKLPPHLGNSARRECKLSAQFLRTLVQATLQRHTGSVCSVTFSVDGKTLASGSWDQTIKLWALPVARHIAADTPSKAAVTELKKLAEARFAAARKAYDVAVESWRKGSPGVRPEDEYAWSVRWLNAQRDMSSEQEDHISALDDHLWRMQELAKVARVMTEAGRGSPLDSSAAEFYLREAELWLAQGRATLKRAGK